MFEKQKLAGRIVEKFGTRRAFAEAVGSTAGHVSNILNGKNELSSENIYSWALALDIPTDEIGSYFFCPKSLQK